MVKKEVPVSVCLDDLRTGRRARVNETECAQLTGRRRHSLQRDRWLGKGMQFQKDENGRIWYDTATVLAYMGTKKHRSTNEYDTSTQVERLERARAALRLG
jgi:hypothetical protein